MGWLKQWIIGMNNGIFGIFEFDVWYNGVRTSGNVP